MYLFSAHMTLPFCLTLSVFCTVQGLFKGVKFSLNVLDVKNCKKYANKINQ